MMKKLKNELKYGKKGITLISLVITIIVLLILAGVTIGAITGDNGLIKNAGNAKEQTEIAEEKGIVDRATIQAMGNNKRGNLVEDELQEQLDKITDNGKTEVSDNGEELEVVFIESNRYYVVDRNGNIGEQGEILNDKSLGNIALGVNGETLPENEYQIWSIEDLVILSNISRGKGNYIENGEIKNTTQNHFSGCTVKLMRNLNFNSKLSYTDLSIGWSYDETNEAYIIDETSTQNLRELLMDKNGVGFVPIGNMKALFGGIFDGQNYIIQNLYESGILNGGLFGDVDNTIKNLKLINVDITSKGSVGGITSATSSSGAKIYNCYVSRNIKVAEEETGNVGGIVGLVNKTDIINCCNLANIESRGCAGGIIGQAGSNTKNIINCYNFGNIHSISNSTNEPYYSVAGIVGVSFYGELNIMNAVSVGKMSSTRFKHSTFYNKWNNTIANMENCYYLNSLVTEKTKINENSISFSKNDAISVVENLNEYVEKHKDEYKVMYGIELYSWKLDDSGLPIFEK